MLSYRVSDNSAETLNALKKQIELYQKDKGELPKIICLEGIGTIAVAEN